MEKSETLKTGSVWDIQHINIVLFSKKKIAQNKLKNWCKKEISELKDKKHLDWKGLWINEWQKLHTMIHHYESLEHLG